jgi:hypothetical protein
MDTSGLLIGTLILQGLTHWIAVPLAQSMARERVLAVAGGKAPADVIDTLPVGAFIMAHVLVLSIAGFLMGLFGWYFLGVSFRAKLWPGVIAAVLASQMSLNLFY